MINFNNINTPSNLTLITQFDQRIITSDNVDI